MPSRLEIAELELAEPAAPSSSPTARSQAIERLREMLPSQFPHVAHPLLSHLRSAREVGRAVREAAGEAPLVTAVPALDELLAGGLPRGQLVEMIGARSSGRFSAVLAVIAAATTAGEAAALVDLGDGLDPQAAAALGVDLRRLLWLRPRTLKQALAATEILLGGGFPVVALDLGNPPVRGGRDLEAAWLRLARAAQAHGAALLLATPYRVSGTAAAAVLQAARGRALWQGSHHPQPASNRRSTPPSQGGAPLPLSAPLLTGLSCRLALEKARGQLLPAAHAANVATAAPAGTAAPARAIRATVAATAAAASASAPVPSVAFPPASTTSAPVAIGSSRILELRLSETIFGSEPISTTTTSITTTTTKIAAPVSREAPAELPGNIRRAFSHGPAGPSLAALVDHPSSPIARSRHAAHHAGHRRARRA
jgi:hypothetical protein